MLQPYSGGEGARRYYQDAAIRALFVCDRDELRSQALRAFQNVFGSDAAEVFRKSGGANNAKNARIHIATYQTLGIDATDGESRLLSSFYPENYFTHVVIDECHRSAWGKWSEVLTRNAAAAQIGLTATPRTLKCPIKTAESEADAAITANNIAYFGEPVYEYDMAQAIEDGYLAECSIETFDLFHDYKTITERESGVTRSDLKGKKITDATTGRPLAATIARQHYSADRIEDCLLMPDRVDAMCRDLFAHLLATGGPEQKTIVFCARDRHADDVAVRMNNLYAQWCTANGKERLDYYAFKCTAASSGNDQLPDLRASSRSHFVATTVDLLTTGVDVPCVRNIVFFKYLKSPISFYQMLGRGTRIDEVTGKLMFRVYDKQAYDLYDVLAELGWGMNPRTRHDRTLAFTYKHEDWLNALPQSACTTIRAIASQFEMGGTEGLENPHIGQTPEVTKAGGLAALQAAGSPAEILRETKSRMFAA